MSYSKLLNVLNEAAENTMIHTIIITDDYTRIKDQDKTLYPLLHVDITSSTKTFTTSGVMLSNYTLNCFLYLGANDSGSKITLTISELNQINTELDDIVNHLVSNLYFIQDDGGAINSFNTTNSVPVNTNGAQCWNLSLELQIFVDSVPCIDC